MLVDGPAVFGPWIPAFAGPLRNLPRLPQKRESRVRSDTEDSLTLTLSRRSLSHK